MQKIGNFCQWKTTILSQLSSCSFTILPPGVSAAACELCVVWTIFPSSPPTLQLPLALTSSDWWLAKVIYLSLSYYIHSLSTHTNTHTHTPVRVFTKTHCAHWFTVYCKRDTIYKRPPGRPLFVCLHLWLRCGSLSSPLSRLTHRATVKTQLYVRLYMQLPCENKKQIQTLLIRGLRGIKPST